MGNRGMTNWKLGAFFVMSLMLIAVVFSNTAMAAADDGKGKITIGWSSERMSVTDATTPLLTGDLETEDSTVSDVVTGADGTLPLSAGSLNNILKFTYTAFTDVANPAEPADDADMVDSNDTAINMAGGAVRIDLSGWTVSGKFVTIIDRGGTAFDNGTETLEGFDAISDGTATDSTVLYQTDGEGTQLLTTDEQKKALARVTFSANSHVVVELDSAWGSGASRIKSREIVIVFGDVTASIPRDLPSVDGRSDGSTDTAAENDVPYMGYSFSSSSKSRNGTLLLLSAHPAARVGNILGLRIAEEAADNITLDSLQRLITISPSRVFVGEQMKYPVKITFVAPGPMHGGNLKVTIPEGLRPAVPASVAALDGDDTDTFANLSDVAPRDDADGDSQQVAMAKFLVKSRGGAGLDLSTATIIDSIITIPFTKVNVGQEVIIEYNLAEIGDADPTTGSMSAFIATTNVRGGSVLTTSTPADIGVTITGGAVNESAGSGRADIKPASVNAGTQNRSYTVTYTAYTKLTNAMIVINTDGIVTVDPQWRQ